jgi:hypothetical protein
MKIAVFWDVAPCKLVKFYRNLKVLPLFIIGAMRLWYTSLRTHGCTTVKTAIFLISSCPAYIKNASNFVTTSSVHLH